VSESEQLVELAGALAGLMREHGELVSLVASLATLADLAASPRYRMSVRERWELQKVLAELRVWASGGVGRGRQRRAQDALDRYVGRARRLG
jgi:hypothetical protein